MNYIYLYFQRHKGFNLQSIYNMIRKKITFILLLALINFLFLQYIQAGNPQSAQDSTSTNVPQTIELIDINYETERVEKKFTKMEYGLEPDARFLEIDSLFTDYKIFLENEAHDFKTYNPYHLSKYFLESTYRSWEGFHLKLSGWQAEINGRVKSVQENIADLNKIKQVWDLTLESDKYINEPEESKDRIREIITRASGIRSDLQIQKRQYIILEDDITDMTSFCNDIIEEVNLLQQHLRDSLFIAVSLPMWKVKVVQSDFIPVSAKLNKVRHENAKTLKNYLETESMGTFWIGVLMIIIFFFLLRYRYIKLNFDDSEPGHKSIVRILIKFPVLTPISLILVFFHLLFPYHPLLIGLTITLILLINMRYILSDFIDRADKIFISKVILLLIINNLEIIFWYFGNVARYFILFETVLGMLLMINYLKPVYWYKFKESTLENKVTWLLALFIFTFYFMSFFCQLFRLPRPVRIVG